MMRTRRIVSGALAWGLVLLPAAVQGMVIDLGQLAGQHGNAIHQWRFEGATPAEQRQDSAGTSNLSRVPASGGTEPTFAAGFDASTQAVQFYGNVAFKSSSFTHPETGTVEYLYRPSTAATGHFVSAMGASGNRLYYGVRNDGTDGAGFGNASWPAPYQAFLSGSTTPDLEAGHWYYVAVTQKRSGTQIIVNAYVADLTEGQTQLTHAIQNVVKAAANANYGSAPLGLGLQGNTDSNFYTGRLDEATYYNARLAQPLLQHHLDVLYGTAAKTYATAVLSDGPTGHWRFEDASSSSGATAANSATLMDGTYGVGQSHAAGAALIGGQSVGFSGTGGIGLPSADLRAALAGAPAISVEAWILTDALPTEGVEFIFATRINAGTAAAELLLDTTGVRMAGRSSTADGYQQKTAPFTPDGQWHHIVGILDYRDKEIRIYIDGVAALVESATFAASAYTPGTSFTQTDSIGASPGGGSFWDGLLDEVAIYAYALSAEQVWEHYQTATVPEPATVVLLGAGLLAIARRRSRRRGERVPHSRA